MVPQSVRVPEPRGQLVAGAEGNRCLFSFVLISYFYFFLTHHQPQQVRQHTQEKQESGFSAGQS
jgi:preprotein translocase subunit YajC